MTGLKYFVNKRNVNLAEVAREIGVSRQSLNQWVNGAKHIPDDREMQLYKILGVPSVLLSKHIDITDELKIDLCIIEQMKEDVRKAQEEVTKKARSVRYELKPL